MRANRILALLTLVLAFALVGAGCGSKSSSGGSSSSSGAAAGGTTSSAQQAAPTQSTPDKTHFAKTKFVLHAGLAFGAFHRYIYKPFKAGALSRGTLSTHKKAVLKAGLAGLFAYHEIKVALKDAKSSPLLSKLVSPLTSLGGKLQALASGLKGGKVDAGSIASSNSDISRISSQSRAAGQTITDQPTPSLGG